jgi:hypothetical protein
VLDAEGVQVRAHPFEGDRCSAEVLLGQQDQELLTTEAVDLVTSS